MGKFSFLIPKNTFSQGFAMKIHSIHLFKTTNDKLHNFSTDLIKFQPLKFTKLIFFRDKTLELGNFFWKLKRGKKMCVKGNDKKSFSTSRQTLQRMCNWNVYKTVWCDGMSECKQKLDKNTCWWWKLSRIRKKVTGMFTYFLKSINISNKKCFSSIFVITKDKLYFKPFFKH